MGIDLLLTICFSLFVYFLNGGDGMALRYTLRDRLARGEFVVTMEVEPPRGLILGRCLRRSRM